MNGILGTVLTSVLLLLAGPAPAQWEANWRTYPHLPGDGPFVLELTGTWEGSCAPSLGTPVVTSFDGIVLEVDLVLDPVPPCLPDIATPYRVLIDVSGEALNDVIPLEPGQSRTLDATVRFMGETWHGISALACHGAAPCPGPVYGRELWPDPGLYQGLALAKQGLLLARQNDRLAAYPLTYDENGSAEWLFAGGGITGDAYFSPLYQASGGQCLGCPPPDDSPVLEPVGNISMVFDSEGVAQVKIDEGPFIEYRAMEFGYGSVNGIPDLSGRWALVDTDLEIQNNGSVPPGHSLPLVFDMVNTPLPVTGAPSAGAGFTIRDTEGENLTTAVCQLDDETGAPGCIIENPDYDDGSHAFAVEILSPERIRLTDTGPMLSVGTAATGIAVRID